MSDLTLTIQVFFEHLFKHLTSVALADSSISVVLIMA